MLILLAVPVVVSLTLVHRYLQQYAPSNLLIRHARAATLRWRTAGLLAALMVGVLLLMRAVMELIAYGGPGWLNLIVLVLGWDAIKFGLMTVELALRSCFFLFHSRVACVRRRRCSASSR